AKGESCVVFPPETTLGSMANYITSADAKHFQPMNANFGLLPPLEQKIRDKKKKNDMLAERALETIQNFIYNLHNSVGSSGSGVLQ
ncbi:MAG: trmFO, partial [Paenibacillus sp.]|nr:trmFO [Paenibacillus sp.]